MSEHTLSTIQRDNSSPSGGLNAPGAPVPSCSSLPLSEFSKTQKYWILFAVAQARGRLGYDDSVDNIGNIDGKLYKMVLDMLPNYRTKHFIVREEHMPSIQAVRQLMRGFSEKGRIHNDKKGDQARKISHVRLENLIVQACARASKSGQREIDTLRNSLSNRNSPESVTTNNNKMPSEIPEFPPIDANLDEMSPVSPASTVSERPARSASKKCVKPLSHFTDSQRNWIFLAVAQARERLAYTPGNDYKNVLTKLYRITLEILRANQSHHEIDDKQVPSHAAIKSLMKQFTETGLIVNKAAPGRKPEVREMIKASLMRTKCARDTQAELLKKGHSIALSNVYEVAEDFGITFEKKRTATGHRGVEISEPGLKIPWSDNEHPVIYV